MAGTRGSVNRCCSWEVSGRPIRRGWIATGGTTAHGGVEGFHSGSDGNGIHRGPGESSPDDSLVGSSRTVTRDLLQSWGLGSVRRDRAGRVGSPRAQTTGFRDPGVGIGREGGTLGEVGVTESPAAHAGPEVYTRHSLGVGGVQVYPPLRWRRT